MHSMHSRYNGLHVLCTARVFYISACAEIEVREGTYKMNTDVVSNSSSYTVSHRSKRDVEYMEILTLVPSSNDASENNPYMHFLVSLLRYCSLRSCFPCIWSNGGV